MSNSVAVLLKLLLDQGIPADAAALFRKFGVECWHVSEFSMQSAEDEEILQFAHERGYMVVTLDADFHTLIAVQGLLGPSVLRLRREGCRAEAVFEIVYPLLVHYQAQSAQGALLSVKERRVTCRRLPVGGAS